MIKYHPEWLSIPQLNIEYYLNDCGEVVKRTKEELLSLCNVNNDIYNYINDLLVNDYNVLIK